MLTNILLLVVNAAGGFLTLMLLARFYMQWQRISFRNQIGQFVVTTTPTPSGPSAWMVDCDPITEVV